MSSIHVSERVLPQQSPSDPNPRGAPGAISVGVCAAALHVPSGPKRRLPVLPEAGPALDAGCSRGVFPGLGSCLKLTG